MKIAIIGSGISGLVAAKELSQIAEVTVLEANDYIGGHTHTHVIEENRKALSIDTGFIVCNNRTYPNFFGFIEELGVQLIPTSMGFSVCQENNSFSYAGTSLNGLFSHRPNLVNPKFWRMLFDILRFNRNVEEKISQDLCLEDYLHYKGYSEYFIERYIIPMGAAIWSSDPAQIKRMPIQFFVRFFHNHGLLTVFDQPQWYVVEGGSNAYIHALMKQFPINMRLNTPVRKVLRKNNQVQVCYSDSVIESFDRVVFACHSDQALRLIENATVREKVILGAIPYQKNVAILHTDTRLLPKQNRAWAAWNYLLPEDARSGATLTYNMNILQHLQCERTYCVSLNSCHQIDDKQILKQIEYEHPVFNEAAISAQARWEEISGQNNTYFCGAYWRWGFHEDGVVSGLRAANQIKERVNHGNISLSRVC